jgi:hypothetical protein
MNKSKVAYSATKAMLKESCWFSEHVSLSGVLAWADSEGSAFIAVRMQ